MNSKKYTILFVLVLQLFPVYSFSQDSIDVMSSGRTYSKKQLKNKNNYYSISLSKGEYFEASVLQKGVDVTVDVYDPVKKVIYTVDSPNGKNGPEPVSFITESEGKYTLVIYQTKDPMLTTDSAQAIWLEDNQGDYEINSITVLTAEEHKNRLDEQKKKQLNIIAALKENAHQLNSVDAGTGFEDLEFLEKTLNDVRFVGLGEATHGTSEFFRMKSRMLEFLIKKMGFTVFLIEASFAGCNNINEYVLNGKGDAYTALASQGFWTWDTEEVIGMIEWVRKYNKSVETDKKVKFLGVDIQINSLGGGFNVIKNYLQKVDPKRADETKSLFEIIEKMDKMQTEGINLDSCKNQFLSLVGFMVMSKGIYVQKSSEQEYEYTLQHARAIAQLFDAYFMNDSDVRKNEREWRDYYMASNFMHLVQNEKPGTKFVIWAHNGHVSRNSDANVNNGYKPMGSYLSDAFGNQYYSFAFSFSKGSFQAIEFGSDGKSLGLQEFATNSAKENSLDWFMEQTGYSKFIIDFRKKKLPSLLEEFISANISARSHGAVAYRNYFEDSYITHVIQKTYDGIIFINNTTRAKPTKTGTRN